MTLRPQQYQLCQDQRASDEIVSTQLTAQRYTMTMPTDDVSLLQAYRGGDDKAFSQLAARYHTLVINACRRQVAMTEVDDCVQAVFMVLARRPAAALRAPALAAWLHRVCHFVCRDARRSAQRRHEVLAHIEPPHAPTSKPEAAVLAQLDSALLRLGDQQRAAVLLHAENNSAQEIAQRLGVSTANAYKLTQRGLLSLRNYLVRHGTPVGAATLVTLIGGNVASAAAQTIPSSTVLLSLTKTSAANTLAQGASMHLTIATVKTALITTTLTFALGVSVLIAADAIKPPEKPAPATEETPAKAATDLGTVTLKVKDMRADDALKWVAQLTNTTVVIDKALSETRIAFEFSDTPFLDVLNDIAKLTGGTVQADKEKADHFTIVPAPTIAAVPGVDIAKEPATNFPPITLRVEVMKAQYVVEFMAKLTGSVIRIDPQLQNQELTIDFQDHDFLASLNLVAKLVDGKVQTVANKPNEFEIVTNKAGEERTPVLPTAAQ